jgi:BASS family bile acid:Na+ symporter
MPQKSHSHYRTLLLLLVAYGLATWLPQPGFWLRDLRIFPQSFCPGIQIQHAMLALMLLCAGLGSTPAGLRSTIKNGGQVMAFTALSWLLPALAGVLIVVVLGWLPGIPIEVRLAVLIVSAMPVANSTAGWANQLRANISLSLAVLMAATTLSPFITAPIINLGILATGLQRDGVNVLPAWGNDMSTYFALWVFFPVSVGVVLSQFLPKSRLERFRPLAAHISLAMLLSLNYVNGTVCLPGLATEPGQFVEPLLAAGLLIALIVGLFGIVKFMRSRHDSQVDYSSIDATSSNRVCIINKPADELSLLLAVVMRNTGAAMVYTSTALASVPLVSLVVLFYTLMQHLFIGTVVGLPIPGPAVANDELLNAQKSR